VVPLGAQGKKDSKEAVAKPIATTLAAAREGMTLAVDKGTLQSASPVDNQQADKGTLFLALHATLSGATADTSLADYDTKLKEPDGSVVEARNFIVDDKTQSSVDLSAGQTRDVTIFFVVKNKEKVNGSYELSIPKDDAAVKGTFTIS
jgi:hypothetical protein